MNALRPLMLLAIASLLAGCGGCGGGGGGGADGGDGDGGDGGGPSIGITPVAATPRFAFVANADGTVSVAGVDAANGSWRHLGYAATGSQPSAVAASPAGMFAYVANSGSDSVTGYALSASGVPTQMPGSPFGAGNEPSDIAVEATGNYCYVANFLSNSISAYRIDQITGALTPVPGSPFATGARPTSLSSDPTGKFLYAANSAADTVSMFAISSSTGALASAGTAIDAGIAPHSVAVDASGRFVYVTNEGSDTVSAFRIQAGGGLVAIAGSPYAVGDSPAGVTSDALGKFLYVVNSASDTISAFAIANDGALSAVAGAPFATAAGPSRVTAHPMGTMLYVVSPATNIVSKLQIDSTSGALTAAPSERGRMATAMAIAKGAPIVVNPKFLYSANGNRTWGYGVNPATGALTAVPGSPFAGNPRTFASDPLGRFLYATTGDRAVSLWAIASATGGLTPVTGYPLSATAYNIAVEPTSRFVYISGSNLTGEPAGQVFAFSVNQTDGTLTPLSGSPHAAGRGAYDLEVDPTGRFVYVTNQFANTISAYSINPTDGKLTEIAGSPFAWDGSRGEGTGQLEIDSSGRLAYVFNHGAGELSIYEIDSVTGVLRSQGLTYQTGGTSFALDPLNRFVYVYASGGLHAYAVTEPVTGALTHVPQSPFMGTLFSTGPEVDPSGKFLVANSNSTFVSVFGINPATGLLTEILGSPYTTDTGARGLFMTWSVQ